ncbi:MAG: DUF2177 family protein [Polymorphobacter sp.]
MKSATAFIATGLGFAAVDSVWLITMSTRLYKPEIGELMAENFRLGPAIIFYLLYITGILVFAVQPALASGKWQTALVQGALFGFFCYMTYDMTNYATLKVWSLKVTILDLMWGTFLTGSAATIGFVVTRKFFPL